MFSRSGAVLLPHRCRGSSFSDFHQAGIFHPPFVAVAELHFLPRIQAVGDLNL